MSGLRDKYPTIRKTAWSWEFENYVDFKAALASEARISSVDALRNKRLDPTLNVKLLPPGQNMAEELVQKSIDTFYEISDAKGNKGAITAAKRFGSLVMQLQKGGYLTQSEFDELSSIKEIVVDSGGKPSQTIMDTAEQALYDVGEKYLSNENNVRAVFDQALGEMRLPKGIQHIPERVKQSAVDVHEGLINVTMSPSTGSMTKVRVWVPQSTSLGPRKAISKLVLGDLAQGMPQKLFFGIMRNFWYSKTIDSDVKRYLAIRYLREFRQIDDAFAIADKAGNIVRFVEPEIYGFTGQGAPGASQKQINKTNVSSARDVAIRTWIQHKNLPAAQTIQGQFKYPYVGM